MKIFGFSVGKKTAPLFENAGKDPGHDLPMPYARQAEISFSHSQYSLVNGSKFPGGFGPTEIPVFDLDALRQRSNFMFHTNNYGKAPIIRLLTNEINSGLCIDLKPKERILGLPAGSLSPWSEDVETRFQMWGKDAHVCDHLGESTFGEIQKIARLESLIDGDVLVVLRNSDTYEGPQVQIVPGHKISTPAASETSIPESHTIEDGVEFDPTGKIVGYWVLQEDYNYSRVPAYGETSGARVAWLVYGIERRADQVRGQPLLAIVLQSINELDKYRDSAQRKALVNSMLATYVEKTNDRQGSDALRSGAVKRQSSSIYSPENSGAVETASYRPGMAMNLAYGESVKAFDSTGTDIKFGEFEDIIIRSIAWALEIPPEILKLSFSSNYSASQAAMGEFRAYLNKFWVRWGETFCAPIFKEWLISEVLKSDIAAPGLVTAFKTPKQYAIRGAWTSSEWYGSVKPSTDMLKQVKASEILVSNGWSTNARESRMLTGTKFTHNAKAIQAENVKKTEMNRALFEMESEFSNSGASGILKASSIGGEFNAINDDGDELN